MTYGLTESHWPDEKTANTVFSMLHHFLSSEYAAPATRTLQLTADNCSAQNKNHWMPWYFAWRVIVGLHDTIEISYLIAGHTKNMCDARFALIKRQLREDEGLTPAMMKSVIQRASPLSACVTADEVPWIDWKMFLERYFKKLIVGLSKFHFFRFSADFPGFVECGQAADDPHLSRRALLAPHVTVEQVKADAATFRACPDGLTALTAARRKQLDDDVIHRYFAGNCAHHAAAFYLPC